MTSESTTDIVSMLDKILEAERSALLSGDLERLPPLLEKKARLIDALNAGEAEDESLLEALKVKLVRNQDLLDGALEGIRKVAKRLALLRRLHHSFDTYDDRGQRQTIDGDVVRRVERRA